MGNTLAHQGRIPCSPTSLSLSEMTKYASVHGLDQGIMVACGSVWWDQRANETQDWAINFMKDNGMAYQAFSFNDDKADHLLIKGKEVYKTVYNSEAKNCDATCLEGCPL